MKEKIIIPENTDLNKIIASMNKVDEAVLLNEETLMFDQTIYSGLPYPLNKLGEVIKKPSKRDMALIATLTILSGIIKKYKVQYGDKLEGCQLHSYILANPGQGKGIATKLKNLGMPYHKWLTNKFDEKLDEYKREIKSRAEEKAEVLKPKRNFLFTAADNSKSKLSLELSENEGYALFFETEADILFTANKSEFGGFATLLRMGWHGEQYSVNRKYLEDGPIEIDELFISIFLTSTLDQCFRLIKNYENGLFSRFMYLLLPSNNKFESVFTENNYEVFDAAINSISDHFLTIGKKDQESGVTKFKFTKKQKQEYKSFFENIDTELRGLEKEKLTGSLYRLGLIFTRICMLLSYLRTFSSPTGVNEEIECNDVDFKITQSIISKLLHHLQIVDYLYETRNKDQKNLVSIPKTTDGLSSEEKYSSENKMRAAELINNGLSTRDVAEIILKDRNLQGTISKWVSKYKDAPFPFPETETPVEKTEMINVVEKLKDAEVSVFENVQTSIPYEVNLCLHELITISLSEEIDGYRNTENKRAKENKKKNLLAFTPSGLFDGNRKKSNLSIHSGFISIDIDEKGNEHIQNFSELKKEFAKVLNVAFCGHSVSGKGYYLLIPISLPENHEMYFDALYKAFKELGIEIDKACRDVSRLRIISYDEAYYMADNAIKINQSLNEKSNVINLVASAESTIQTLSEKTNKNILYTTPEKITTSHFLRLLRIITEKKLDITARDLHWFMITSAIANRYGDHGRNYFHDISRYHPEYFKKSANYQYTACVARAEDGKGYTLKKVFEIAKEYGLVIDGYNVIQI